MPKQLLNWELKELLFQIMVAANLTAAPALAWMNYHQFLGNARTEKSVHHIRYFAVDYNP